MHTLKRLALTLASILALSPAAMASTVVLLSTTGYSGADEPNLPTTSLPATGPYILTENVSSTFPVTGLVIYAQQVGLSGNKYTIVNSTFSTCNASPCYNTVAPDVYLGGTIKIRYVVTSGSFTVTVQAAQVNP